MQYTRGNTFYLLGEITAEMVIEFLEFKGDSLFICSPGGPGGFMLAMLNHLNNRSKPQAIVSGQCLSAAVPILAMCSPRIAEGHTQFQAHGAESKEDSVRNLWQALLLADNTCRPIEFWFEMVNDATRFSVTEALE